ncbi:MAG: signal peptidase I [Polyangia bacterium]
MSQKPPPEKEASEPGAPATAASPEGSAPSGAGAPDGDNEGDSDKDGDARAVDAAASPAASEHPAPRWLLKGLTHIWLLVFPLYVAAFVAVILVTNRFDLSGLPWPGLARALLAGLLVGAVLGVPYLLFRRTIERARDELVLRHDAELAVKESRRRLKKQGGRLSEKARGSVTAATSRLETALKDTEATGALDPIARALTTLENELEAHLADARKGGAREYSESIGVAVLIALLLRAFVIEAFKIPSGSMIPTLEVGDHIFVKKFLYGARIPWTDTKILSHLREPRRGEVIVFVFPNDPEKDYIKRIVGIPGDSIEVCGYGSNLIDARVKINGTELRREPVTGPCEYEDFDEENPAASWRRSSCVAYREWNGDESYTVVQSTRTENLPPRECHSFLVPHDSVFVMGDNRDNSYDSRFWPFGNYVHYRLIKGKAWFIWWSTGERAVVRLRRMFTSIHH